MSGVCVKTCPNYGNATIPYTYAIEIECVPTNYTKSINTDDPTSCQWPDSSYYYSSDPYFGEYCLPIYDSLTNDTKTAYDNLVSAFGGDYVGQAISDVICAAPVIAICGFLSLLFS